MQNTDDEETKEYKRNPGQETKDRLTAQEIYLRQFQAWAEKEFTRIGQDVRLQIELQREEQSGVLKLVSSDLRDIRDRVIRLETKDELSGGALTPMPMKALKNNTGPMNKSLGHFLGDIIATSLKTVGVAAVAALILFAFQKLIPDNNSTQDKKVGQ